MICIYIYLRKIINICREYHFTQILCQRLLYVLVYFETSARFTIYIDFSIACG